MGETSGLLKKLQSFDTILTGVLVTCWSSNRLLIVSVVMVCALLVPGKIESAFLA